MSYEINQHKCIYVLLPVVIVCTKISEIDTTDLLVAVQAFQKRMGPNWMYYVIIDEI